jgi:hypothetical protein
LGPEVAGTLLKNFTPAEANKLRRSMATFRSNGGMEYFESKLVDGMVARGYEADFALRCFTVNGPNRRKTVVFEIDRDQLGDRGLVLDNQNFGQAHDQRTTDSTSAKEVWRTSAPLTM